MTFLLGFLANPFRPSWVKYFYFRVVLAHTWAIDGSTHRIIEICGYFSLAKITFHFLLVGDCVHYIVLSCSWIVPLLLVGLHLVKNSPPRWRVYLQCTNLWRYLMRIVGTRTRIFPDSLHQLIQISNLLGIMPRNRGSRPVSQCQSLLFPRPTSIKVLIIDMIPLYSAIDSPASCPKHDGNGIHSNFIYIVIGIVLLFALLQELLEMASEQLSYELYKWLSPIDVLPANLRYKSNGNFQLDRKTAEGLLNGSLLARLLVQLAADHGGAVNGPLLASIKQSNTPAARVYNWNILTEGFAKLNVNISKETQMEITSGNFPSLTRFLLELHKRFNPKKPERKENEQEEVNLKRIQVLQSYTEAETFLQAIILLIGENFSLTPKQTVSTLAENAKYYAHMIVKGIKNSYAEVLGLIDAMINAMPQLMFLCEKSPEKNTEFFLDLIKPTLISREPDVAKRGAQLFRVFLAESLRYNSKNLVYQLLCREGAGFDFLYMGLKRHPDLAQEFSEFLELLVGGALKDFFEVHLKRTINNQQEYLKILLKMLEGLVSRPQSKAKLKESGLIDVWLRNSEESFSHQKSKEENNINQETKLLYLELLCSLWRDYSSEIDQQQAQSLLMRGIEQLKRNTRKNIYTIKIPALLRLFDFLHYLADCKNKVAPILYKKLIFLLIENHQQEEMREIILANFTIMLRSYPTIPVDFLLDPFLRQLINCEGRTYILNVFDFQFMLELCRHPKMDVIYGLSYLEYFSKLYIKSFIYARQVIRLIEILTGRFCEEETIVEFLKRNVDSTLNLYGILVLNKKKLSKEDAIINKQKKALAIELIKRYIQLEHRELGVYIQDKVAALYSQWVDQRNNTDKGLKYLLNLFGDDQEIVLNYRLAQNRKFQSVPLGRDKNNPAINEQPDEKQTPKSESYKQMEYMKEKGIGYKPDRRGSKTRMEEMLDRAVGKPNPKVLKDIESLKEKMKENASRKQMQQNNQLKKIDQLNSQHNIQLLQRNLSLGYAKLAPLQQDKIIFDFDSVKPKQLKMTAKFHSLSQLEQQDEKTAEVILKQYAKQIKSLFHKYALISATEKKDKEDPSAMMSFTEVVKMTKEKSVPSISKLALSDMIASINHPKRKEKNVLSGIQEADFNEFLIKLTDFIIQEQKNAIEVPFGVKLQVILKILFQGEPFYENRLRVKQPANIGKLREQLNRDEQVQIPQGYRKVKENQIELKYNISQSDWGLNKRYQIGLEITDWLLQKCVGLHAITPLVEVNQRYNLLQVPKPIKLMVPKQATDAKIKYEPQGNSEFISLPKEKQSKNSDRVKKTGPSNPRSLSHRVINKTKTQAVEQSEEEKEKMKKQIKYAEKLRENLEKMRQEKTVKEDQEKLKKEEEKKREAKREEERKKYLQQNKQKLKQLKMKEEQEKLAKQNEEKLQKQRLKNQFKKKQQEMLQKHKQAIKQRAQKVIQKKRELQNSREKKAQNLQRLAKEVIASKNDNPNDRLKMLQLKNSLQNGALKEITTKYDKQLTDLFQAYWTWDKKRIDLNGFALIFKDFKLTPELIYPKILAETFKTTARGPSLDFQGFKECLMKCAYRSDKLLEQHSTGESETLNPAVARAFLQRLKVDSANYREILKEAKGH